jgi:hypothetical protein
MDYHSTSLIYAVVIGLPLYFTDLCSCDLITTLFHCLCSCDWISTLIYAAVIGLCSFTGSFTGRHITERFAICAAYYEILWFKLPEYF